MYDHLWPSWNYWSVTQISIDRESSHYYKIHFFSRFGDLLALAEDLDECRSTRVLRRVPSRRASEAASNMASTNKNHMPGNNMKNRKISEDDMSTESESSEVSSTFLLEAGIAPS